MRKRQAKKIFKRMQIFWCCYVPEPGYKESSVDVAVLKMCKERRRMARKWRLRLIDAAVVLLFLLLPSICLAQATAIISGPTEAAPGDLIILDASQSDCDARVWLLVGSDKSFLQFEDNKKCVFASGASGSYHFVLATAKHGDSAASVASVKHTVTIGGPQPKPAPTPNPKPGPKPPQPEPELTGLAKTAFEAATSLERKPGECSRVAGIYETAASKALALSWTMQELLCFIAVDDTGNRPGLLCDNSWPKGWILGPKRHNQPDGSFWVDADTADRMLKQNDSFAVPGFNGYAAANLDWSMF